VTNKSSLWIPGYMLGLPHGISSAVVDGIRLIQVPRQAFKNMQTGASGSALRHGGVPQRGSFFRIGASQAVAFQRFG